MDVEIALLKKSVASPCEKCVAGITFVSGKIEGKEVCVAKCNPGKVNAALCTQLMIDLYAPEQIINLGIGCSLSSDVVIKDVVIANEVCQYDIDSTCVGDPLGFISGLNIIKIETDSTLSNALMKSAKSCGCRAHLGCIASGDTFVATQQLKDEIADEFGAICGEMEGGAIGHVCFVNSVAFAVLRTVSDGGDESAQLDYPVFKEVAADISSKIILDFLKN